MLFTSSRTLGNRKAAGITRTESKKLTNSLKGNNKMGFHTPPELMLNHNYLDVLNGYNLAKLESALSALAAADIAIGKLRPAALPNTEGINRTVPMHRITEIKAAIVTAAKLVKALEEDTREVAGIPTDPLKGGK
jgi:hypothetical protein